MESFAAGAIQWIVLDTFMATHKWLALVMVDDGCYFFHGGKNLK